jgi:hypothetical protein
MLAFTFAGCMNLPIEGDCNKSLKTEQETVHCSMYGFNWDDNTRIVRKTKDGIALAKVEYNMNGLDLFLGAITLGLYVPVELEYWPEAAKTIERLPKKSKAE